jgi:hypothetical protein
MTVKEYQQFAKEHRFDEAPSILIPGMSMLEDFVAYEDTDLDLKIHLAKVALIRNFSVTGSCEILTDHSWLIGCFLKEYEQDLIRPWLTPSVRSAMEMIQADDPFSKGLIATTFLFGIIETYSRFLLEEKEPLDYFNHHELTSDPIGLGNAINKLKKSKLEVGSMLGDIDKINVARLKAFCIEETPRIKARIADRLTIARNAMLHGENHNFFYMGNYLCVLYMLFHFCRQKQLFERSVNN